MSVETTAGKTIQVGTLFIGGGPATLGVFAHVYQTNKYVSIS